MRPDGIPQDVWDGAKDAYAPGFVTEPKSKVTLEKVERIARAILAERERCAKIARNFFPPAHTYASENADIYHAQDSAAAAIANAINPSPADPPRGDNISPTPLGDASNDDFATIPHLGDVS
jgi:hypothetical protein